MNRSKQRPRQKRELPSHAKRSKQIAEDIYVRYGALVSISDVAVHFGVAQNTATNFVKDLPEIGHGTGKRYYYEDVAEAVVRY